MTDIELQQSLQTLRSMADRLGAEISVVRERVVEGYARDRSTENRQARVLHRRKVFEDVRKRHIEESNMIKAQRRGQIHSDTTLKNDSTSLSYANDDSSGGSRCHIGQEPLSPTLTETSTQEAPPPPAQNKPEESSRLSKQKHRSANSSCESLEFFAFDDGSSCEQESDEKTQFYKVAEVLIRKLVDDQHFLEVRVAFLGGTDAGKVAHYQSFYCMYTI
jgi:hypothetical protein